MKTEIEDIKRDCEKLRQDLMASNLANLALLSVLTFEQQDQVLKTFAQLAVMQEQTAEKMQKPELISSMQAGHQRLYTALQGAKTMRAAKLQGTASPDQS
jgi:hypothetical protein